MANRILPEFQDFLLSRSLVPERNAPFYAHWVSKFLAFSKINEDLGTDLNEGLECQYLITEPNYRTPNSKGEEFPLFEKEGLGEIFRRYVFSIMDSLVITR